MPTTIKESPDASGVRVFKYTGPQAQIQVNRVTIMAGNSYETDSEDEITALRARMVNDKGLIEIARKSPDEVSADREVDADEDAE